MANDIDPKTDVYLIPATEGNKGIIKIFIKNECIKKEYTTSMLWNLVYSLLDLLQEKTRYEQSIKENNRKDT